jgi:hypothetical protein
LWKRKNVIQGQTLIEWIEIVKDKCREISLLSEHATIGMWNEFTTS